MFSLKYVCICMFVSFCVYEYIFYICSYIARRECHVKRERKEREREREVGGRGDRTCIWILVDEDFDRLFFRLWLLDWLHFFFHLSSFFSLVDLTLSFFSYSLLLNSNAMVLLLKALVKVLLIDEYVVVTYSHTHRFTLSVTRSIISVDT